MASVQTDRTGSVNSSSAIKVPCRVATTADLTPSLSQGALNAGGGGLFTIDGIALNAGDRVLVKNQTDQTTNGIWLAATTSWLRDVDAQDNRALVKGTLVLVTDGTLSGGLFFELTTANPITIGSSNITFAVTSNPTISGAMSPVVGAATLAAARTAMAVPGLGDNNTFSGTETFNGAVTFGGTVAFNGAETDSATLTMTNAAINEARSTIASAATTNIGAAAANYLQVTGVTGITAFDMIQAGTRRILEFAAALTLSNGANLILPGGANITTAAGDVAGFVSEGAGVWRCTGYMKASGLSPFTKVFISAQQAITAAGGLTLAHGLVVQPTLIQSKIHCVTAEAGYSIGDEVIINTGCDFDGTNNRGLSVVPDTTNLNVRYGSSASPILALNKSSGVATLLTPANWKLIVSAWA